MGLFYIMLELSVVNIKLSLKIASIDYQDIIDHSQHIKSNRQLNFIVIFSTFTYTIFKPTNSTGYIHCNVTKIRNFSAIASATALFFSMFPQGKLMGLVIDNTTSVTKCDEKKNLDKLFVKLNPLYSLKYNLQKFPAIFIKYPLDERNVTVFIFSSGKVICVGAKNQTTFEQRV